MASASSTYAPAYPVSAINNNERAGTGWGNGGGWADGTPGTFPDWVQITFNGSKTIDRVVVYSLQDNYTQPVEPTDSTTFATYGITAFTVQGWNGTSWITLATVSGNNLVKRSVSFPATTTDRIRINITAARSAGSYLTESKPGPSPRRRDPERRHRAEPRKYAVVPELSPCIQRVGGAFPASTRGGASSSAPPESSSDRFHALRRSNASARRALARMRCATAGWPDAERCATVLGNAARHSALRGERSAAAGAVARTWRMPSSRIDFNVSHTRRLALHRIARDVAATTRIGVDIEHADREVGVDLLARKFLTARERETLAGLPLDSRRRRFLRYWTCKEAMSKATGDGIIAPFGRLDVDLSDPPRFCAGPPPYLPADWSLHHAEAPRRLDRDGGDLAQRTSVGRHERATGGGAPRAQLPPAPASSDTSIASAATANPPDSRGPPLRASARSAP